MFGSPSLTVGNQHFPAQGSEFIGGGGNHRDKEVNE